MPMHLAVWQVRECLQEACDAAAAALSARRSLLHALGSSKLGPLLECDDVFFGCLHVPLMRTPRRP